MIKIESLAELNAFRGNNKSIKLLIEVSELSFYAFFFRNNSKERLKTEIRSSPV